jgi:uncharacterized protein
MSTREDRDEAGVIVPLESLRPETLRAVVEEFVSREGTDYGPGEHSLDDKVEQVLRQLRRGEAQLSFDSETGSIGIVAVRRRR